MHQRRLPIYLAIPSKREAEYHAIAAFQRAMPAVGSKTGAVAPAPMKEEKK
ncbi:MAG TPA: hypothetical protein PLP22_14845 [Candidatus Competibacter sp.]|nr:hypothetical protein [Candidatus Competibacter sp.]HUM93490.1 hypothetical protein [Candidatus Competibacter sp.]